MQVTTNTVAYARFNIEITATEDKAQAITKLQQVLHDAATEACADEFEIFYSELHDVIGVSVPVDPDLASVLEAGNVLGYCQRAWEESDAIKGSTWLSLVDGNGEVMDSPLGY
jgi:hypothetical protein